MDKANKSNNFSNHEDHASEQGHSHHPSDGTVTTSAALVDVGVVMRHLQEALAKIEHLEVEVQSLKSKEQDEGGRAYDFRREDDDLTRQKLLEEKFSKTLLDLENQHRKGTTLLAGSFDLNHIRLSTDTRKVSNLKAWSLRKAMVDSDDIAMHQDEDKNVDESFLSSMNGANGKRNSDMIVKVDVESGNLMSSSEELHFLRHKFEEMLQSIGEMKKEQARTNEELRSLVSNRIEHFQSHTNTSSVNPDIYYRERKMRMTMFGRVPSVLVESGMKTSLDEDTFSLMMISRVGSKPWILGAVSSYLLRFRITHFTFESFS